MSPQVTPQYRAGKPVALAQARLATGSWHRQKQKRIARRVARPPDPAFTRPHDNARGHRVGLLGRVGVWAVAVVMRPLRIESADDEIRVRPLNGR